MGRKKINDWDLVLQKYYELGSYRKTAEVLSMSKTGVEYIVKKVGDPLPQHRTGNQNSIRKAIANNPNSPSSKIRDPQLMEELYLNQKLSCKDIGIRLGIDPSRVKVGLEQCGIKQRTLSEELKGRPRPNSQGSKNHNWKGGLTGWRKLSRGRLNEHFVRPIMERDNFACQWCGSKKKIVVHHDKRTFMEIVRKVESKISREDVEEFVSGIVDEHDLSDGITLCKKCHDSHHKDNGK